MTDIFLSYANTDLKRARLVAKALEAKGWSVWWDRNIPPGKSFDEVIEAHLDAARCVLVLWSAASVRSHWVKAEAEEGRLRGCLFPAQIDEGLRLPLGFRRIQTASLVDWRGGNGRHAGFDSLLAALDAHLGPSHPSISVAAPPGNEDEEGSVWMEPTTGLEFVRLPGGCFQMGSPKEEEGRGSDEKQHEVCIDPFALATTTVTNAQYRLYQPKHNSGSYEGYSLNGDTQPVVDVSWEDAVAYAEWLCNQTGQRFRLPTEAEWEYAARAGTQSAYYWGDTIDPRYLNFSDKNDPSGPSRKDLDDGYGVSAPVGKYRSNDYGLYDMLGNVWEWTCSGYSDPYDGSEKKCIGKNHAGPRVLRGGSWDVKPARVRSADRDGGVPGNRLDGLGFRLAQDT